MVDYPGQVQFNSLGTFSYCPSLFGNPQGRGIAVANILELDRKATAKRSVEGGQNHLLACMTNGDITLHKRIAEIRHRLNAARDEGNLGERLADLDVQKRFDLQFRLAKGIQSRDPVPADPLVRSDHLRIRVRDSC